RTTTQYGCALSVVVRMHVADTSLPRSLCSPLSLRPPARLGRLGAAHNAALCAAARGPGLLAHCTLSDATPRPAGFPSRPGHNRFIMSPRAGRLRSSICAALLGFKLCAAVTTCPTTPPDPC